MIDKDVQETREDFWIQVYITCLYHAVDHDRFAQEKADCLLRDFDKRFVENNL